MDRTLSMDTPDFVLEEMKPTVGITGQFANLRAIK